MAPLLPYLLISVKEIKCDKVSLSDRQNLRIFSNTLAAGHKYSLLNRDNLTQPIQMHISKKQKDFSEYFPAFWKSR